VLTGGRGRLVVCRRRRAYIIIIRDRRRPTLPLLPCHHRCSRRSPRDIDNNVRARERVFVRASVYIIRICYNSGRWAVGGVVALLVLRNGGGWWWVTFVLWRRGSGIGRQSH